MVGCFFVWLIGWLIDCLIVDACGVVVAARALAIVSSRLSYPIMSTHASHGTGRIIVVVLSYPVNTRIARHAIGFLGGLLSCHGCCLTLPCQHTHRTAWRGGQTSKWKLFKSRLPHPGKKRPVGIVRIHVRRRQSMHACASRVHKAFFLACTCSRASAMHAPSLNACAPMCGYSLFSYSHMLNACASHVCTYTRP